jgi:hypothetical protein
MLLRLTWHLQAGTAPRQRYQGLIYRLCRARPPPAHFVADLPKCYSLVRSRRQR